MSMLTISALESANLGPSDIHLHASDLHRRSSPIFIFDGPHFGTMIEIPLVPMNLMPPLLTHMFLSFSIQVVRHFIVYNFFY